MSRIGILVTVTLLAGCQQVEDDLGHTQQQSIASNGVALNGTRMHSGGLLAVYFNGISFNGISFNGISFNGISFNGISFNGSELTGTAENGISFNGTDFIGATADTALTADGSFVTIRIDDITSADAIYYYTISYYQEGQEVCEGKGRNKVCTTPPGEWLPICGTDDAGVARAAILLQGMWSYPSVGGDGSRIDDPDAVTVACTGAALAKCVQLGYRPWETLEECTGRGKDKQCTTRTLADHHQACTRMIRADYCGTGVSHTVDGWSINVYDADGIQYDASDTWPFEAEWSPNGATCLNERRTQTETTYISMWYGTTTTVTVSFDGADLDCEVPVTETCGDTTAPQQDTLLFNESEVLNEQTYDPGSMDDCPYYYDPKFGCMIM